MAEDQSNALEILTKAIKTEQDGIEFYLKAAEATDDEKGSSVFRQLARDEKNHMEVIQKQYDSIKNDMRWARLPEVKKIMSDLHSPLFPQGKEDFEKSVTKKSTEIDAILFGLDIENKSFDLYKKAGTDISDTVGREMFEFLAAEERGHFDMLMMRYQYLTGHPGY